MFFDGQPFHLFFDHWQQYTGDLWFCDGAEVWHDMQSTTKSCYGRLDPNTISFLAYQCFGICVLLSVCTFLNLCMTISFLKLHVRLDHLCIDQAGRLNPLQHSTYDDEDYVGKIKRLCILAAPQTMGWHVLERYSSYVCVRWLRSMTT